MLWDHGSSGWRVFIERSDVAKGTLTHSWDALYHHRRTACLEESPVSGPAQDAGAKLWFHWCLAGEESFGLGSFDELGQGLESAFLTVIACM